MSTYETEMYEAFQSMIVTKVLEPVLVHMREKYQADESLEDLHQIIQSGWTVPVTKPRAPRTTSTTTTSTRAPASGERVKCSAETQQKKPCSKYATEGQDVCIMHLKVREKVENEKESKPKRGGDEISSKLRANPTGPITSRRNTTSQSAGSAQTAPKGANIIASTPIPGTNNVIAKIGRNVFKVDENNKHICIGKMSPSWEVTPLTPQDVSILERRGITYEEGDLEMIDEEAFIAYKEEHSATPTKPAAIGFKTKPLGFGKPAAKEETEGEEQPAKVTPPKAKVGGFFGTKPAPKEDTEEDIPDEKKEAVPKPKLSFGKAAPSFGKAAPSFGKAAPSFGKASPTTRFSFGGNKTTVEEVPPIDEDEE